MGLSVPIVLWVLVALIVLIAFAQYAYVFNLNNFSQIFRSNKMFIRYENTSICPNKTSFFKVYVYGFLIAQILFSFYLMIQRNQCQLSNKINLIILVLLPLL